MADMLCKGNRALFFFLSIVICDYSVIYALKPRPNTPKENGTQSYSLNAEQGLLETTSHARYKRGIVLIDEDFDKLPDERVRQSWSGENSASEMTSITTEIDKESSLDEGSGSSIVQESTIKFSITPGELLVTKEKSKLTSLIENTVEGSGEDIKTFEPTETENIGVSDLDEKVVDDELFTNCMNFTCSADEVNILPGFAESLSEDSALILMCSMANYSYGESLRWYRSNGSDSFQLETSIIKGQLQYAISKVKVEDSGKYVCLRLTQQSCCHRQLDVIVYKKPNYKFHIMIVGLVAIVSLFVCLLLGIHRRYTLKKYKKDLKKSQIPLNEFLL